jgi:nicotinamidase-related amidase
MTTLERDGTALLVIDVQKGVVEDAFHRARVIANINEALGKARASNTPIVWVQHADAELVSGSTQWEIVDELTPLDDEQHIYKRYGSSFEDTNLDEMLSTLNVGHLVITGAQTNACVRHTIHAALERGYDVTLVSDAHTTSDIDWEQWHVSAAQLIDEQNLSLWYYELPGRLAQTVKTSDLSLA